MRGSHDLQKTRTLLGPKHVHYFHLSRVDGSTNLRCEDAPGLIDRSLMPPEHCANRPLLRCIELQLLRESCDDRVGIHRTIRTWGRCPSTQCNAKHKHQYTRAS